MTRKPIARVSYTSPFGYTAEFATDDNTVRFQERHYTLEQMDDLISTLKAARQGAAGDLSALTATDNPTPLNLSVKDLEKLKVGAAVKDSVDDIWVKIDSDAWVTMPTYLEVGTNARRDVTSDGVHRTWAPLTRTPEHDVKDI